MAFGCQHNILQLTQEVNNVAKSDTPEIPSFGELLPLDILCNQWGNGAYLMQICFLVMYTFHKEKNTWFNCV